MDMKINPSEYKILVVDDVMSNLMLLKVLFSKALFVKHYLRSYLRIRMMKSFQFS